MAGGAKEEAMSVLRCGTTERLAGALAASALLWGVAFWALGWI